MFPLLLEYTRTPTTSGRAIPDPVVTIRRLAALEVSISSLRSESQELAQRRAELAREVGEAVSRNVRGIEQVRICDCRGYPRYFIKANVSKEVFIEQSTNTARLISYLRIPVLFHFVSVLPVGLVRFDPILARGNVRTRRRDMHK